MKEYVGDFFDDLIEDRSKALNSETRAELLCPPKKKFNVKPNDSKPNEDHIRKLLDNSSRPLY